MYFTNQELRWLERREISLNIRETINGSVQRYITAAILQLNAADSRAPITLYIDSTGGNLHAQLSIIDAIRMSSAPVHGVVTGFAGSSAFNILQFCTERKLYPHADLMFHGLDLNGIRIDDPDLEEIILRSKRQLRQLLALIGRRSGQSLAQLRTWARESKTFTAKESLALGFADEIIPYTTKLPGRKLQ